jgi:hypothetical protein
LGVPVPKYADGRVWSEVLKRPTGGMLGLTGATTVTEAEWSGANPYSAHDAAIIERRLRGLGYRP